MNTCWICGVESEDKNHICDDSIAVDIERAVEREKLQKIVFNLSEQLGFVSIRLIAEYKKDEQLRDRMLKVEEYNNMLREALGMST